MKKNLFSVLAVMAAFTFFTVSCGDKKSEKKETPKTETVEKKDVKENKLEALVKKENTKLPKEMMEGMTLAEVTYGEHSISFYLDCVPELYQGLVSLGEEANKAQMLEGFKSNIEPLQQAAIDDEATVFYIYTNVDTNETFEFNLTPEDIAAVMGE